MGQHLPSAASRGRDLRPKKRNCVRWVNTALWSFEGESSQDPRQCVSCPLTLATDAAMSYDRGPYDVCLELPLTDSSLADVQTEQRFKRRVFKLVSVIVGDARRYKAHVRKQSFVRSLNSNSRRGNGANTDAFTCLTHPACRSLKDSSKPKMRRLKATGSGLSTRQHRS